MPFKIPGERGTFYKPGERKGNAYVLWRGRDDAGVKGRDHYRRARSKRRCGVCL